MAIPVTSRAAERTCRGKAGKSKAHPHYAGRVVVPVSGFGYVTRCTSCGQVCAVNRHSDAGYQPIEVTAELAIKFLNTMI